MTRSQAHTHTTTHNRNPQPQPTQQPATPPRPPTPRTNTSQLAPTTRQGQQADSTTTQHHPPPHQNAPATLHNTRSATAAPAPQPHQPSNVDEMGANNIRGRQGGRRRRDHEDVDVITGGSCLTNPSCQSNPITKSCFSMLCGIFPSTARRTPRRGARRQQARAGPRNGRAPAPALPPPWAPLDSPPRAREPPTRGGSYWLALLSTREGRHIG